MILGIIAISIVLHESAHVLMGLCYGGRWLGLRFRWSRVAVVMDMTGLTGRQRRRVAGAGTCVDATLWLGFVGWSVVKQHISHMVGFAIIWFSLILIINATPWISGTDGWYVWKRE
jgi:hypothetical protein